MDKKQQEELFNSNKSTALEKLECYKYRHDRNGPFVIIPELMLQAFLDAFEELDQRVQQLELKN